MKAILQSEATECGLASIAMIADFHGKKIGLSEIRRRYPLSLKGAKLAQLIHIAHQLGLSSRPLRLEMEHLSELKLPCILHWDLSHYVVLAKVGRSGVRILDPAIGERVLALEEVSEHFTGVALELAPTSEFQKEARPDSISLRQLTGQINGLWP